MKSSERKNGADDLNSILKVSEKMKSIECKNESEDKN